MRFHFRKALAALVCLALLMTCGVTALAEQLTITGGFTYSEIGIGVCSITGYTGTSSAIVMPASIDGLSVVAVADNAFAYNTTLVTIGVPAFVKVIGNNAFTGCTSLKSVMLAEGLQTIGANAFAGCTALTSVILPASLKNLYADAFNGCTFLASITVKSSETSIDPAAFNNCGAAIIIDGAVAPTPAPVLELTPANPPAAEIEILEPEYTPIDEIFNDLTIGRSSVCYPCNYDVSEGCAIDGKLNTAWNSDEYAVGEWLSFTAPSGVTTTLAGIRIINGYIKSDAVYRNNSRVRTFDLYCDGQYVESIPVADVKTIQTIWLSKPVSGNNFRFEIAEAYYGSKYNDLGITEIELMGVNNEDFHTGDFAHWGRAVKRLVSKTKDGSVYRQGDDGYAVVGLQILLKRGFGLLSDEADGYFGQNTRNAVLELMDLMRNCSKASEMEPMSDGVVDAAFMRNLRIYIKTLN